MNCMQFARGVAVGMAVGSALTMLCAPKKRMNGKKMFARVLRAAGDAFDDVTDALGL